MRGNGSGWESERGETEDVKEERGGGSGGKGGEYKGYRREDVKMEEENEE